MLNEYNIQLGLSNITQSDLIEYINSYSNITKYLNPNLLTICIDDKRQNPNTFISNSNNNGLIFIDNESQIHSLTYSYIISKNDIPNGLNTYNNISYINIDNKTLKERNQSLYTSYSYLNKADFKKGIFMPDSYSLQINNDHQLTLNTKYFRTFNQIDQNINSGSKFKKIISENQENINRIMWDRFDGKLPIKNYQITSFTISKDIIDLKNHIHNQNFIDYDSNEFYIICEFEFQYECDGNPILHIEFNPDNLTISGNNYFDFQSQNSRSLSFIYDQQLTQYLGNNKVAGKFKYALYTTVNSINEENNTNGYITENISITYKHDYLKYTNYSRTIENQSSKVTAQRSFYKLFSNSDRIYMYDRLYHNYYTGFNFKHNGNYIGQCIIPQDFYIRDNSKNICPGIKNIKMTKAIFYYNIHNEPLDIIMNNINNINNSSIKNEVLSCMKASNNQIAINNGEYPSIDQNIQIDYPIPKNNIDINGLLYKYHKYHLHTSNGNLLNLKLSSDYTSQYNTSTTLFNDNYLNTSRLPLSGSIGNKNNPNILYNIFQNISLNQKSSGVRKTDLYIPNLYEACFVRSSTTYSIGTSTIYEKEGSNYFVYINSNGICQSMLSKRGNSLYFPMVFKIPDLNCLYGKEYNLLYSNSLNCEVLHTLDPSSDTLTINIQKTIKDENINLPIIEVINNSCIVNKIQLSGNTIIISGINKTSVESGQFFIKYQDSDPTLNTSFYGDNKYRTLCKVFIQN